MSSMLQRFIAQEHAAKDASYVNTPQVSLPNAAYAERMSCLPALG